MKAKEFIIDRLKQFAIIFDEIKIRYELRANTQSHLIEIIPLKIFEENNSYIKEEARLEDEFERLFPTENIIFISEDSLTEIKNAEFELGYDKIKFKYDSFYIEFEVEGYNEPVATPGKYDYALAA